MAPARILIATPCAGGVVTTEYLISALKLMDGKHIDPSIATFSLSTRTGADVSLARNALAAKFMADPDFTHIFFLDADMGVEPSLVLKYLALDKPFAGALYPYRQADMDRIAATARRFPSSARIASLAQDYVCGAALLREERGGVRVFNGFARSRAVGGGAMFLKREVFEKLRVAYPDLLLAEASGAYPLAGISGPIHQCFSPLQSEGGGFLSEDLSFCERWIRSGGEIWACVDEEITHAGQNAFAGKYIDRLAEGLIQK